MLEIVFVFGLPTSVRGMSPAGIVSPDHKARVGAKDATFVKKCQAKFLHSPKKELIFKEKLID